MDAGTFDRSGMWMNAGDNGYAVVFVSPGGAVEAAGIQKDDIVTVIEGKPVIAGQSSDARALLRMRPPESSIALDLLRNGKGCVVKLVLQEQL
jgi:S1-C subfamily serine protease